MAFQWDGRRAAGRGPRRRPVPRRPRCRRSRCGSTERRSSRFRLNDVRHRYRIALPAAAQRPGDNRLRFVFAATASPVRRRPEEPRPAAARRGLLHASSPARRPTPRSRTCWGATRRGRSRSARRRASRPDPARAGGRALRAAAAALGRAALHAGAPARGPRGGGGGVVPRHRRGRGRRRAGGLEPRDRRAGRRRRASRWCASRAAPATSCGSVSRWGPPGSPRFAWGRFVAPRVLGDGGGDPLQPLPVSPADDARAEPLRQALARANVLFVILDAGPGAVVRGVRLLPADDARDRPHRVRGRRLRARLHAGRLHARRDVVGVDVAVPRPPPQRGLVLGPPAEGPPDPGRAALRPGRPHRRLRGERGRREGLRLRPRLRRVPRGLPDARQPRRRVPAGPARRGSPRTATAASSRTCTSASRTSRTTRSRRSTRSSGPTGRSRRPPAATRRSSPT